MHCRALFEKEGSCSQSTKWQQRQAGSAQKHSFAAGFHDQSSRRENRDRAFTSCAPRPFGTSGGGSAYPEGETSGPAVRRPGVWYVWQAPTEE